VTDLQALAGYTVAVTAARRREEFAALLTRRGARVVLAPTIRIVPLDDDTELRVATDDILGAAVDIVVGTTGVGFRGWIEAADGWGVGEALRAHLAGAEIVARGPKVRGAIRAAGLKDAWAPESELMGEVLDRLLARDLDGTRIVVQLHGDPLREAVDALRAAGAQVVTVPVYRWTLPDDVGPAERLIEQIVSGELDAVTFTSASGGRRAARGRRPGRPARRGARRNAGRRPAHGDRPGVRGAPRTRGRADPAARPRQAGQPRPPGGRRGAATDAG